MTLACTAVPPVGIVGIGTMGSQIAELNLRHGIPVRLFDVQPSSRSVPWGLNAGEPTGLQASKSDLVTHCSSIQDLQGCRLIIECITEKVKAKRTLFCQLRNSLGSEMMIASNTSSIPIAELTSDVPAADRLLVLHFFHPVRLRKLVEIVCSPLNSEESRDEAVAYCRELSQIALLVPDGEGFLVNRLLYLYFSSALELARTGLGIEVIDAAALDFGMDLGPFEYLDMIGLDVAVSSGSRVHRIVHKQVPMSNELLEMVNCRKLGVKTLSGFYNYSMSGARLGVSGQTKALGLASNSVGLNSQCTADVFSALITAMYHEACILLEKGFVKDSSDIDLASCHAFGFPGKYGGLMSWARAESVK